MRVTPTAVRDLARISGMPEDIIHRYMDELITFTFTVAKRERKHCQNQLRAWVHSGDVVKPDLLDVLKPKEEDETIYDVL